MEFQTQQYKLFPAIATVFAIKSSATWLWDVYNSVTKDLDQGDLDKLPEVCIRKSDFFLEGYQYFWRLVLFFKL